MSCLVQVRIIVLEEVVASIDVCFSFEPMATELV